MAFPFELSVDLSTLAILALVAFIAGFIDAIAGGGGLLTIPALLTAGLPPHLALGTNKLSSTFGSAAARRGIWLRPVPAVWQNTGCAAACRSADCQRPAVATKPKPGFL